MKYSVFIRNNETGEVRECSMEYKGCQWDDSSFYWWKEGNMECDCNRETEFLRAGGVEPEWDAMKCSSGRFSVLYALLENGTKISIDE